MSFVPKGEHGLNSVFCVLTVTLPIPPLFSCGRFLTLSPVSLALDNMWSFNQEKNSNNDVKEFCEVNFNINFPLSSIYEVKGKNAHEIFKWAKDSHGSSAIPKWNFHKILINKEGKIQKTYSSFVNPMSQKITDEIDKIL